MSNIIYSMQVIPPTTEDDDITLQINSNDFVARKLELFQEQQEKKREEAARKAREELMMQPAYDEEGNPILDEEGNQLLMRDIMPEEEEEEGEDPALTIQAAQEEAENILSRARMEADQIIEDASRQAEALRGHIEDEAKREGYNAGLTQAGAEMSEERRKLDKQAADLLEQYEIRQSNMERELVSVIADTMSEVFHVMYSEDQELILHIVENAVTGIEGSKQFLIKVNEENFAFLQEQKASLIEKVGTGIQIDILNDPVLTSDQVMIETDGGLFDCSMDTQLKNLTRAIKALSLR